MRADTFEALVAKHQQYMRIIAWRKLRSWHAAEDAVQDALLNLWEDREKLPEPESPLLTPPEFLRDLGNRIADQVRRRVVREEAQFEGPAEPLDPSRRAELAEALSLVPAEWVEPLYEAYGRGTAMSDLAEDLGLSHQYVREKLSRVKRKTYGVLTDS